MTEPTIFSDPLRLGVWSGARHMSTCLRYCFAKPRSNLPYTPVALDEPFYGCWLDANPGINRIERVEVTGGCQTDPAKVIERLTARLPGKVDLDYQKHFAYMMDGIDMGWLHSITNAFLIREPSEVITSLLNILDPEDVTEAEIGVKAQFDIFEQVSAALGKTPPVIDQRDILTAPGKVLSAFCEEIGLPYSDGLLSWPAGPCPFDGPWARHWYDAVWQSTGFRPYRRKQEVVPSSHRSLQEAAEELYAKMAKGRITG